MSKHTPTPWTCSNEGWGDGMADVRGPDHQLVCRIPILLDCPSGDGEQDDNAEYEKNRAVILAAPDLFEACSAHLAALASRRRDGKEDLVQEEAMYQAWKAMMSAVAKARGAA